MKAAIIILAGTDGHEAIGRLVNALETAKEFQDAGDDTKIVFDGAATQWIPTLADTDHTYHELYQSVQESVAGACKYCANAYKVADGVREAGVAMLDEWEEHPSIRALVKDGYDVITF